METKTLVNLNTAEESQLAQVPGIGPALAKRIVAARPFDSWDDVRRVSGIGASTLDRIAPYATVAETLPTEAAEDVPADQASSTGLGFVDVTPLEDEGAQHVAEVPADLIPLPPLPVVPPWDEEMATVAAEESQATPEVVPPSLLEAPPPLPEVASSLPEAPASTKVAAQKPNVAPPPPQPRPQAAQPVPPKSVTRGQLGWVGIVLFILTLMAAVALSLGILAGINGGLTYASPDQVAQVSREVAALKGQASTLEQSLNSVQTRLNNLEALSGRIEALETAKGDMQRELETLSAQAETLNTQVQDLNQQTEALSTQMEEIQAQSSRFQQVMNGLRDLLNNLFPNE